tara:strand:+ start:164 stop:337 length:174 start_codon:yes stop_codon:yes gene_type:complete
MSNLIPQVRKLKPELYTAIQGLSTKRYNELSGRRVSVPQEVTKILREKQRMGNTGIH